MELLQNSRFIRKPNFFILDFEDELYLVGLSFTEYEFYFIEDFFSFHCLLANLLPYL